jgi:hypothetical protein
MAGLFGQMQPQQQTAQPAASVLTGEVADALHEVRRRIAPYIYVVPNTGRVEYVASDEERLRIGPTVRVDPNQLDCSFKAISYKPKQKSGAPPEVSGAMRPTEDEYNPDPENLDAVPIYGIQAFLKRFEENMNLSQDLEKKVVRIGDDLRRLNDCDIEQRLMFEAQQRRQAELYNKMLKLLGAIEKLRSGDRPLEFEEYKFREKVEEMLLHLRQRHAQLTELINFQSQHDLVQDEYADNLSDADLEVIYGALAKQHEGLQHVSDILERDIRDVGIIRDKIDNAMR